MKTYDWDELGMVECLDYKGKYYLASDVEQLQADHAKEIGLLREVYESARQVLRYNGIDKERVEKAIERLKDAIDEVKLLDSGLCDDEAMANIKREQRGEAITKKT